MCKFIGRFCPWLALGVICLLHATASATASAQTAQPARAGRLKLPTIAASAAAAADWASTYHALKNYKVREVNPLLRPFESSPGSMISLGGIIDAGGMAAWNLSVGRNNPRLAAVGLWSMAAFRAYLAIHNMRNTRIAERR
jgi:hypothetical protein